MKPFGEVYKLYKDKIVKKEGESRKEWRVRLMNTVRAAISKRDNPSGSSSSKNPPPKSSEQLKREKDAAETPVAGSKEMPRKKSKDKGKGKGKKKTSKGKGKGKGKSSKAPEKTRTVIVKDSFANRIQLKSRMEKDAAVASQDRRAMWDLLDHPQD